MQCEMQSILSRIWTRVAVSISYDYNHYTTGTYSWFLLVDKLIDFDRISTLKGFSYDKV